MGLVCIHAYSYIFIYIYIPRTQMTLLLIGSLALFWGIDLQKSEVIGVLSSLLKPLHQSQPTHSKFWKFRDLSPFSSNKLPPLSFFSYIHVYPCISSIKFHDISQTLSLEMHSKFELKQLQFAHVPGRIQGANPTFWRTKFHPHILGFLNLS